MKLKKILFTIFLLFVISLLQAQTGPPACNDFVSIEGKNFKCGGQNFYPLVVEYSFHIVYNSTHSSASDYFLSRDACYGPETGACDYESNNETTALNEILNDLAIVHQMGFNCIRTHGIWPSFNYIPDPSSNLTCQHPANTFVQEAHDLSQNNWSGECMAIETNPALTDAYRDRYFYFIRQILEKAEACSLKVLLDVAGKNTTQDIYFNDYKNYVELLAQYVLTLPLNLRQTLLAFVIVEEPNYTGQTGNTKFEICNKTSQLYDIIKAVDPNHYLITLGGESVVPDIYEWDPGVMKLDFWCPHLYPDPQTYEPNSDRAVDRVRAKLFWLKNNCPMPWMIGETGFGAIDDNNNSPLPLLHYPDVHGELGGVNFPSLNGEIYTQQKYAEDLLKYTRDCGGSGFSIWEYQEFYWNDPSSANYNENAFGLLRHGEAATDYATLRKPVVDEFENYLDATGQPPAADPAGAQQPASYYDPFYHAVLNSAHFNAVTGTFLDDNGNPIKSGVVQALNWLYFDGSLAPIEQYKHSWIYSCADENGDFEAIPYNPTPFGAHRIVYIRGSAPGASKFETPQWALPYGWTDIQITPAQILQSLTTLDKINFDYDGVFDGETINQGDAKDLKGWNSVTVSNSTIDGTSDITARQVITINSEFHASNTSEVHIFPSDAFIECGLLSNFFRVASNNAATEMSEKQNQKEIEVTFTKNQKPGFAIIPNPNSGMFNLEIYENKDGLAIISIKDPLGNELKKITSTEANIFLNLHTLAKGVYFVEVVIDNNRMTKKLIVN